MLRIATRGSRLARWQAERVAALLGGACELVVVSTTGDRRVDVPIESMGGQGVFVKEVQDAVLVGRADLAVHSAKDLPALTPDGLVLACVPERADPRDALVGSRLDDIPEGGTVATGSVRRRAQLAVLRPDLRFEPLRGNIGTRLEKAAGFAAVVVAAAALERLGLADRAAEVLAPSVMVPQVGQGALAVECRADDGATAARLAGIEDRAARLAVDAERAFLRRLGGGCDLPCGALARVIGDAANGHGSGDSGESGESMVITTFLAAPDGGPPARVERRCVGTDAESLGTSVADLALEGLDRRR